MGKKNSVPAELDHAPAASFRNIRRAGLGCRKAVTLASTRNRAGWNAMNRGIEI
jgi:hypothetical protein